MNNKPNIDRYTKELISKAEIEDPGKEFTKKVMKQILQDPSVKVNFITRDDKNNNVWLVVSVAVMVLAYSIFMLIKNKFSFNQGFETFEMPTYIDLTIGFFSKLWSELSLSPYILIALLAVLVLVILDKFVVRYFYSI